MRPNLPLHWIEPGMSFSEIETKKKPAFDKDFPVAASSKLTTCMLLDAYSQGIFPWSGPFQPILWWCPDPRMVLLCDNFKFPKSLKKKIKQEIKKGLTISVNNAFHEVITSCAEPRKDENSTWITTDIVDVYTELNKKGYAHSVEVWMNNTLVGGLYLVAIGSMVFGESMFFRRTDSSKIALCSLILWLKNNGGKIIDCQQETQHLANFGASPISIVKFKEISSSLIKSISLPWNENPLTEDVFKT